MASQNQKKIIDKELKTPKDQNTNHRTTNLNKHTQNTKHKKTKIQTTEQQT
jgi:hypothetical protein